MSIDHETYAKEVTQIRADVPNTSWENIAKRYGMDKTYARKLYWALVKGQPLPVPEPEPLDDETVQYNAQMIKYLDKKSKENINWRELINLAATNQVINERLSDLQRTAEITITTDKPIGIVYTGDWHLGDTATDHKGWSADIDTILSHPRMYMIDLGDDLQNMRVFQTLSAVLSQVLQPRQQAQLLRSVVDELTAKDKLLAKIRGNHDGNFDERIFGEALQSYLLEKMKAPQFDNRGLLKLTVGQETYTMLLFHKSRFSSFMRNTHGAYREYQLSYPADIVAGGHDHVPGFELINNYQLAREAGMPFGGTTYLIKCGTYQDSDFGWKYFHNGGRPVNITVVLWPKEHRMQVFFHPEDAIQFLDTF